jgi:argininosuccinate lyase
MEAGKKLWAGRIQAETNALVDEINKSLSVDQRMWRQDISGSIAHAQMLGKQGIISQEDANTIVTGLQSIVDDLVKSCTALIPPNAEDIHMGVEQLLTERIGEAGKRLHTARSRNDQVATDIRLYVIEETHEITALAKDFQRVLIEIAKKNLNTVMPGYTHLQRAQPVTLAHYMCAYAEMLSRDISRLTDCRERITCPLGAGALAGTTYPINREFTAETLGFAEIAPNSLDAVADRDFCIELLSALSILMTHISRLAEEIILWCSMEFNFAEPDDAFATGSSMMPQKKNPDVAELVRGKTGRVYGSLINLLTVMKALPLAYNKDMQEDKEPVFDAIDTVKICLRVFAPMLETMKFKPENMRQAAAKGFLNATDCADYLVKKGLPFRDAYGIVGRLVSTAISKDLTLDSLNLTDFKAASNLFENDIYDVLNLDNCVNARNVPGGPAPAAVSEHIKKLEVIHHGKRI